MNAVVPVSHSAPADLSDWYGSMMGRTGDWYGSMMGGLKDSITNLVASDELDQLARSISKLQDALVASYDQLTALKKEEAKADALAPVGPPTPGDELYVQGLSAQKSVSDGYRALTGFDYMTQVIANVFTPSAAKLESVYGGITGLLGSIRNWNSTWQNQIGASHPDMVALWDKIQNEHNRLWAQAKKGPFSYDDPAYLTTAQQAVQSIAGIDTGAAAQFGMGDFGITALIGVIVVAVAAVAIAIALVKLAGQFNAVANNIAANRKDYEATMAKRHDQYVQQRLAEGADVQTAETEWAAIKKQADAEQAKQEDELAKKAPGLDLTKILTYGGVIAGGAVLLPHILKAVGVGDIFGIGEFLGIV